MKRCAVRKPQALYPNNYLFSIIMLTILAERQSFLGLLLCEWGHRITKRTSQCKYLKIKELNMNYESELHMNFCM